MMQKKFSKGFIFTTIFLFSISVTMAQSLSLNTSSSKLLIDGDSNIHKWTITGTKFTGQTNLADAKITALNLKFPVDGLKSGKDGMDENTCKALKSKEHPNITFELTEPSTTLTATDAEIVLTGNLTISGFTKKISMKAKSSLKNGVLSLKASVPIKMTEYKVVPPTAVFGTIKTYDNLLIKSELEFK